MKRENQNFVREKMVRIKRRKGSEIKGKSETAERMRRIVKEKTGKKRQSKKKDKKKMKNIKKTKTVKRKTRRRKLK